MKRLIQKIVLIFLLALVSCTFIFLIPVDDSENYLMANDDKLQMISSTKSPKVVLVGGSNLAFGIDSKLISDRLDLPVINMGLHAGLGIEFMINQVKPYLGKEDLVVLVPEYSAFIGSEGSSVLLELLDLTREGFRHVDPCTVFVLLKHFPEYARSKIMKIIRSSQLKDIRTSGVYFRHAFNENGDVVEHLRDDKMHLGKDVSQIMDETNYNDVVPRITVMEEFSEWCRVKEVNLLVSFPPYPETHFEFVEDMSKKVTLLLLQKGLSVISNPVDYKMEPSLFFDTLYHLNSKGRAERTAKLIDDIIRFEDRYNY